MDRRTLLATLGVAATAGCQSAIRTDQPTETPPNWETPTETPTPHTDPGMELGAASIVDLRTTNRTYALAPLSYRSDDGAGVRMQFSRTATADHPATVEASLRNENPFPNTFRLEWTPPFGRLFSDSPRPMGESYGDTTESGLLFVPTANHDLVDDPPTVTRTDDGLWRLAAGETVRLPERVRLDAGETIRGEYALVGRADAVGEGRPPGVYEFSRAGERPVRVTVWQTDAPGPTRDSRFAGRSVPVLGDSETAWFHDADRTTPTFVRPSTERTSLPAAIRFTFLNRSRDETRCGHWNLYALRDGAWFHLGPYVHTADCRFVRPGGSVTWTVRAANGELAPCDAQPFPYLGGGIYAAVAGYGHATSGSGVLVRIDAPPVTVVPTADVTSEQRGGVVTATSDRWRNAPDAEGSRRARLVVEPADEADRRVIREQVMRERNRGLRNTLAFVGDADRVVLRTDDATADDAVGYDATAVRLRFDGTAYRIRRAEP